MILNEFKKAFQHSNNAHVQLIVINIAVFLLMTIVYIFSEISGWSQVFLFLNNQFSIPPQITEFAVRPWTLFTYSYAHSLDIFHILFNMLALYWFGRLFIEYLGSDKLIAVYVLGGLAGGFIYIFMFNTIPFFIEHSDFGGMVGSSASVYAIMIAVAVLLPDYTFFLLFIGPVKIKYITFFYVIMSFIGSVGTNAGGNIAHLGGALMGYIYIKQLQAGVNWGSWIIAILDWFRDFFGPAPNIKVTYRGGDSKKEKKKATDKISQEEIDTILDKISEGGYESLTKEEKQKLFDASKK